MPTVQTKSLKEVYARRGACDKDQAAWQSHYTSIPSLRLFSVSTSKVPSNKLSYGNMPMQPRPYMFFLVVELSKRTLSTLPISTHTCNFMCMFTRARSPVHVSDIGAR